MKRFLVKFCALFSIIWGLIGFFKLIIVPQLSGDMGNIGKIPFGKQYTSSINEPFSTVELRVRTIIDTDSITGIITIGDSFSQLGKYGYSQFLAATCNCAISNIARTEYCPEQEFITLVNNEMIPKESIVIVESVERSFIGRLNDLDFTETKILDPLPKEEKRLDALNETLVWIRTTIDIKQPITKFHTNTDLFSHETRHNELYIYNSKWDSDGDIQFVNQADNSYVSAYENLYRLHDFAVENGINLLYLVAADKYDVYEPFIIDEHIKNPTLDSLPDEEWIINSKPILQNAVYSGVKDVYYINDTHWSPIGSKIVGEAIANRLIDSGIISRK